jgi:ABC-2 type transport system ATP-binding protein
MKDDAIVTQGLTKRFGSFSAVKDVNLHIKSGDVYALVGPNGAGKTTLVKMLVGLLAPTEGTARLFGHDVGREPIRAKEQFGYVSDDPTAYDYLTGKEFLVLTGRLRGMSETALTDRIKELVPLFPIEGCVSRKHHDETASPHHR